MKIYVLLMLIVYAFFVSLYMFLYYRVNKKITAIFKQVASLMFIILAIICVISNQEVKYDYVIFIVLGLICGFIGDGLLAIRGLYPEKKTKYFLLGLLTFFVGHVLYLYVLLEFFVGRIIYVFFLSIGLSSIVFVMLEIVKINFGKLRLVNYLYMFICSMLLSVTIINLGYEFNIFYLLQFIGFLFFTSSDLMLCFIYFKKVNVSEFKLLKYLNIATYYVGQGLIALSILYLI